MDNVTRYAAINTKLDAMEGNFLNSADYKAMMGKRNIIEIADYLKVNKYYNELLSQKDVNNINRIELEIVIKEGMAKNGEKIINYFNGEYKTFIQTLFMKYEIEDLKSIARNIYNKKNGINFETNVYLGRFTKIDKSKAIGAKLIRDLIFSMENTELYRYFIPLIDGNIDENLFRFETVLDLSYYNILKKNMDKLDSADISVLKKALGLIADLLNIQWVYRGVKYYRISPEELLNYTINFGSSLSFNDKKQLCYSKSIEEFYSFINKTKYSMLFQNETEDVFFDRSIYRYIVKELKKLEKIHRMTIIKAFNFVTFSELEVKDIISVIELVGYDMDDKNSEKYLIQAL